jgi:hypothetical protein
MGVDRGVWLLTLAPVALGLGAWPAVVVCGIIVAAGLGSDLIFTLAERNVLKQFAAASLGKVAPLLRRVRPAPGA